MTWDNDLLLDDLGLGLQDQKSYQKRKIRLSKGEVDPRTMGGVSMVSKGNLDADGILDDLSVDYWVIHPDGRYQLQQLFHVEIDKQPKNKCDIKNISVLGRDISLQNMKNVNNVMEAIRLIHISLRDKGPELPNVAKIFEDCGVEAIVGESLNLTVFDAKDRIRFPITQTFNHYARGKGQREFTMPLEAFLPLAGMRHNTLDTDLSYDMKKKFSLRARRVFLDEGERFEARSSFNEKNTNKKNKKRLDITLQKVTDISSNDNQRSLARVQWKTVKKKIGEETHSFVDLKHLQILGQNTLHRGFKEAMAAIGVVNKTHTDMLNSRDYPNALNHMATYGLLDAARSSTNPPKNKKGRFIFTSVGGNNLKQIVPGIGEEIGGNCKKVETQWIDQKTKEVKRLGALLDFGSYLIKTKSDWSAGHPDVVEDLKNCKNVFITHHHLDHIDGLIPYIKRGLIGREHTVHMTPEVYDMLNSKLTKAGIKKDDHRRPQINILEGTGVIDLHDDRGICRMSVAYGVDAVPHSAKDTPFIAYGRHDKEILGSYMYLGDMRFDEEWFEDHPSAFWDPQKLMLEHDPELNPEHCIPTYTEIDGTSVRQQGRSTSERVVRDNISHVINEWCPESPVLVAMIGTNDGRRESLLEIANRTNRNITAWGAAVVDIFKIGNKCGINPYKTPRPASFQMMMKQIRDGVSPHNVEHPPSSTYTGIKDYLEFNAQKLGIEEPSEFRGGDSLAVKDWVAGKSEKQFIGVVSGSQGNPIEFESTTYKLSEGRSRFDADSKDRKNSNPLDLKDAVIIFSQSAIPGNSKYQEALIKRLATRGATVIQSVGDDIRIHNPAKHKNKILQDLAKFGHIEEGTERDLVDADGSIYIRDYAIHASGHGKLEDFKLWLDKLQAKYVGMHHTDDRECVRIGYKAIEDAGCNHTETMFHNGEEVEITNESVERIGKTIASAIVTNEKSEDGKLWNTYTEAARIFNFNDSPYGEIGLQGDNEGFKQVAFGIEDNEDLKKRQEARQKLQTLIEMPRNTRPIEERIYEQTDKFIAPDWDPDHPALLEL